MQKISSSHGVVQTDEVTADCIEPLMTCHPKTEDVAAECTRQAHMARHKHTCPGFVKPVTERQV